MNARRGEVFYIKKFEGDTVGSEQDNGRPYLVVSPDGMATRSRGALCAPLTTQPKKDLPQHCEVICKYQTSTVLCEQLRYIDESRFGDYCATLTAAEMAKVDGCLLEAVGIPAEVLTRSGNAVALAEARDRIRDLERQLIVQRNKEPVVDSAKDAEIEALKKEVERLKLREESYINLLTTR